MRAIGGVLAVVLCLALASGAAAGRLRTPAAGSPAITIDAPDGWTMVRRSPDHLIVLAADRSGMVHVMLVRGVPPSDTLQAAAEGIAQGIPGELLDRQDPFTLGRHTGRFFYVRHQNGDLSSLALVRVDRTTLGVVMARATAGSSRAQTDALLRVQNSAVLLEAGAGER